MLPSITANLFRGMNALRQVALVARRQCHCEEWKPTWNIPRGPKETDDEFVNRVEADLNRLDIDPWELRQIMNMLAGVDGVPDPKLIVAALKAARRNNDYAITVRFLECVKCKCGNHLKKFYPYILQEIRPTLDELGINLPEEMGYDKPELHMPNVYEM